MKTEKLLRVLGGVYVILALVTLLSLPAWASEEKLPIKIGLLGSFTGSFAGKGQQAEAGTRMWLDEAGWEVAGRKIELITEDDASNAEMGLEKVRKLIGVNKVDVVLGPLKTEVISAVAPYCAQQGIPIICHGAYPLEEIEAKNNTLIVMQGPEIGNAVGFGRYVIDKMGYKTVVYIAHDFRFARTIHESFAIGYREGGGTVLKETYVPFGTMDFTSYLMAAGRPDCLSVFLVAPPDILLFYRQYHELGLHIPILSPCGGAIQPVLQKLGKEVIGIVGWVPYADSIDTDINKRFVENFQKKYGYTPGTNDNLGYEATAVFLNALMATSGDTTPAKVLEALKKTKLDLPSGYLEIGSDRMAKKYMYIFECVEKGGTNMFKIIDKYLTEVPKK